MIYKAIRARIPLVSVKTPDTIHLRIVLQFYINKVLEEEGVKKRDRPTIGVFNEKEPTKYTFSFAHWDGLKTVSLHSIYESLREESCTVFIINSDDYLKIAFEVGELLPCIDHITQLFGEHVMAEYLPQIIPMAQGLTIKEILDISNIAMAEYKCITPTSFASVKNSCIPPVLGLNYVNPEIPCYTPNPELKAWLEDEGQCIHVEDSLSDLAPRGLLFEGVAGTGKSLGAKYVANELNVPLYNLCVGELLGKYVGESETRLREALMRLDSYAPAVVLIDEVEKLFEDDAGSNTTRSLLALLLWWLQEHSSRVLTIMTTNNSLILPKELYRSGRIDRSIIFEPLNYQEANELLETYRSSFDLPRYYKYDIYKDGDSVTAADVISTGKRLMRLDYLTDRD